jgi:DNA-binding phage protein
MTNMEPIGKMIKEVIRKRGLTYYRVAKDLGIDHASFHRSMSDDGNPEWKRIKQILDYLDCDIILSVKRKEVKPLKSELARSRGNKRR